MDAADSVRKPAIDPDEDAPRLAAVRRYDILDTPPDGSFDRITAIAADLFSAPISIISIVDQDRIWFKSHHGLDAAQVERGPGLCASAILQEEPWILTNAAEDVRSLANPLVAGDFGLRFYVGVPLRTHDGFNLGTLCVIDREPRAITERQVGQLRDLASVVMDQLELRLSARRAIADLSKVIAEKDEALRRSEVMSKEIDHRVMNSLQLIAGLLRLQSRSLGHSEASDQLALAASRVSTVARVHQHIYLSERVGTTECKGYLERLCRDLSGMLPPERGEIVVDATKTELRTEQIVPLGLIVNELVTNAVKHGGGRIVVAFHCAAGHCTLTVSDEGPGIPPGFEAQSSPSLGMKVVCALIQQLGGELRIDRGDQDRGARFTVAFHHAETPAHV